MVVAQAQRAITTRAATRVWWPRRYCPLDPTALCGFTHGASVGRGTPVATGLSLCLYLNCAPEAGKESSGSLGLFLAFAAGVAAVPPPSPDATPFEF